MSSLRALFVALTILAMAMAPLIVPGLGVGSSGGTRAYATTLFQDNDNDDADDDDDDDGDNDDNDDADNDNDDDDGDNEDDDNNDNADDDDSDDNDNDVEIPVAPPPADTPPPPAAAVCTTPGQEIAFQSADSRVTVRVFSTMSQSLKFSIRQPIDPGSVPPPPGTVVGGLLFQLIAETCDGAPLATLPAEINLGIHYSDAEAAGLNEAAFKISRLNTNTNQWQPEAKQAADPAANFTSATITEMGYYVLHQ